MISFERSFPDPPSLKQENHYDTEEVRERLFRDARGKCYLCEAELAPGDFEIDHRKPKADNQFPELLLSWRNLYCCCHKCNQLRPRLWPDGGLLSPDVHGDDVEGRLVQWIDNEAWPCFRAAGDRDVTAANTAEELRRVHGAGDSLRGRDLQNALLRQLDRVHRIRHRLGMLRRGTAEHKNLLEELRRLVSRRAPFTALVRSRFSNDPLMVSLFD